jgi:DNA-directed RNA polymerase subunit alpha
MSRTRIPLRRVEEESRRLQCALAKSVAEIGLAPGTISWLHERDIFTVEQLLNTTRDRLLSISYFGERTLEELYAALERNGFYRPHEAAETDDAEWEVEVGDFEGANDIDVADANPEVPEGIVRSSAAFRRQLGNLLRQHEGKWVAFHHEQQIALGNSKTQLYQNCLGRGLSPNDFIVRRVVPDVVRFVEDRPH